MNEENLQDGFFLVSRSIIQSAVFQNEKWLKVWIWCLLKASHKTINVPIKTGKGTTVVEVNRGQFIYGRNQAAKELDMNGETVRVIMAKLKSMENLTIQTTSHYSVITICKYNEYQDIHKYYDTKQNTKQTPSKHQANTTYKEEINPEHLKKEYKEKKFHENKTQLEGLENKQTLPPCLPKEESIKQPSKQNSKTEIPEFEALWKLNPKKQHSSENKQASKKKYLEALKKFSHELIAKALTLYWRTARKEAERRNQIFDPQFLKGMAVLLNTKSGALQDWIEKISENEAKEAKSRKLEDNGDAKESRNTSKNSLVPSNFEENEKLIPEHTPVDFEANKGYARALIKNLTQQEPHGNKTTLPV